MKKTQNVFLFIAFVTVLILLVIVIVKKGVNIEIPSTLYTTKTFTESNDVLRNVGTGIVSFESSNNYDLNGYSIDSSILYYRWYWNQLEPTEGNFNFALFDKAISNAKSTNRKVIFRIMPHAKDGINSDFPEWLKSKVSGNYYTYNSHRFFIPNYNDPKYLEYAEKLLKAFGDKYGDNPYIEEVDVGLVGEWGEWHLSGTPYTIGTFLSDETKKKIIDLHFKYFKQTKLVLINSWAVGLSYGTSLGSGWRADCLGDYKSMESGDNWWHHRDMYMKALTQTNTLDVWKTAPVHYETCYDICYWYNHGYDINEIIKFSLDTHMSVLNIKEPITKCNIPTEWRDEVTEWQKKMGYRLVLNKVEYTKLNKNNLAIISSFENKGVAPPYNKFKLKYLLINDRNKYEFISSFNTKELMGVKEISNDVDLSGVVKGKYTLKLGIFEEGTNYNINLAILESNLNGWYEIGEVEIR